MEIRSRRSERSSIQSNYKAGIGRLKDKKYHAVSEFVSGKDVSVSFPTSGGKSLCCAVPLFDILRNRTIPTSMLIVVSPLIALMKDQVATFQAAKG